MGLVYRAYHADLERTGAVKVLQAITPDADTVARFRHEAQAIAQLRHPNIVNVYDFGAFQGVPYMIVEYIPGGSLAARMARGGIDQTTAIRYLRGIAAGLDYAHGHGVVHRDVKPANVLLTSEDAPVLADFGLAKLLQGTSLKSMTGVTTGTPAYMAPEQVTGHQVGPAADRYSLATIAYEMLTGVIPFDGEALMELLYAQVHRYPSPPSARDSTLSPQVDAVIMRGLAKSPNERWESCTAFVDALAAAFDGGGSDRRGPAQATQPTAPAARPRGPLDPPTHPGRLRRGRPGDHARAQPRPRRAGRHGDRHRDSRARQPGGRDPAVERGSYLPVSRERQRRGDPGHHGAGRRRAGQPHREDLLGQLVPQAGASTGRGGRRRGSAHAGRRQHAERGPTLDGDTEVDTPSGLFADANFHAELDPA